MSSSLSSAGAECPDFEYDPHGRQGIGVAQPQSGIDYPLVNPSADVRYLIADLQLQVDDPGMYGGTPFQPPFRLHWLYGVGCTGEEADCLTSLSSETEISLDSDDGDVVNADFCPTHAQDLTIVDRDGRVVFHSPDAEEFTSQAWGDREHVYQWRDARLGFCLLVVHTKWPAEQSDFEPRHYPKNFFPLDATLDERAVYRLPKRVRSITVILDNLARTGVDFVAGHNMELVTQAPTDTVDRGLRHATQLRFNVTPGAGRGIFPGCDPAPLLLRRINGVAPTDFGDFYLAATDCYWVRQPTRLISTDPRVTYPQIGFAPGNVPTANLPDPNAGTAKNLPGWPLNDDPRYAHLQLGNDCMPCCDCDDYVNVAEYMNSIRDQYHTLGNDVENTRDLYHANISRWLEARECFHRRPLRIFLQAQVCPFLDIVVQFCNQSDKCRTGVELIVDFSTSPHGGVGTEVPGFTFITGAQSRPGRRSTQTERYEMGGSWPQFTAYFDAINPGQSVYAKFRLVFDNCGIAPPESSTSSESSEQAEPTSDGTVPYAVTGRLTGTEEGEPVLVFGNEENSSESSGMLVEAVAIDTETLNCPPGPGSTFNALTCVNC